MTVRVWIGIVLLASMGCGSSKPVPPTAEVQVTSADRGATSWKSAPGPTPAGERVPRAEFVNWSQFPVGTRVTRVRNTTNNNGTVTVTTRSRLVEKNDQKVVVESQVDVQRPKQELEQNDPMKHEFPASFVLPPGMNAEQFSLPSMKAEKLGVEKLVVLDKEYEAEVFQWDDSSESGPIHCKLWSSPACPGRILKQEQYNESAGFTSTELVTEISF